MLSELQTLLTQQKRARETLEQQLEEEKVERKKLQTALQVVEGIQLAIRWSCEGSNLF